MKPAKTPKNDLEYLHPFFLIGRPGEKPCRELRGISAIRFRGEQITVPALPRPSHAVASVQQRTFFVRREFYGEFEGLWIEVPAEHPLWDRADPMSGAFWDFGVDAELVERGSPARTERPKLPRRSPATVHPMCGLHTCFEDDECAFPMGCVGEHLDRTAAFKAGEPDPMASPGKSDASIALAKVASGENEDMRDRIAAANLLLAGQTPGYGVCATRNAFESALAFPDRPVRPERPAKFCAGQAVPIRPDDMLDPMDPDEYNWRAEGRDQGWTAPDRRPWWKRLPIIRHAAALRFSWQVHNYAGGWAAVGIGVGGPHPQDLWVVEGYWHGYI
jgi:hypothetical protein